MLSKIGIFVRWLLSSEKLVTSPSETQETSFRQKGFIRWLFSSEELTKDEVHKDAFQIERISNVVSLNGEIRDREERPAQPLRTGFIRWLISREKLDESISGDEP